MPVTQLVPDIAHTIQLAVAPVFLLSGVGVTLTVLTNRLGRIVDRARLLEGQAETAPAAMRGALHAQLETLSRRATLVNRALTLATSCALLICGVIVALFVGGLLGIDLSGLIALLFVIAMVAFIGALVYFLREIFLSIQTLQIGPG